MQVRIAAVGRLRDGPMRALLDDYAGRIEATGRPLGFPRLDICEVEAPKGLSGAARRRSESELLAGAAGEAERVILDERGENLSSDALARRLERWRDGGARRVAFLIGGAEGHDPSLLASPHLALAFGKATFPHLLVRVMLAEQIYRAMTILAGHPYHRA